MRYVFLMLLGILVSGCARNTGPLTPAEQEAQEQMMRNVLNSSSPRDMNEHPKVTDEFKTTFNTGGGKISDNNQNQSSQEPSTSKQSEDDEESWW